MFKADSLSKYLNDMTETIVSYKVSKAVDIKMEEIDGYFVLMFIWTYQLDRLRNKKQFCAEIYVLQYSTSVEFGRAQNLRVIE